MGRKHAGFTLIEIVAVLLIVALVAGLGIASLRGRRKSATVESVTRQVLDYDRSARLLAQRHGMPMNIAMRADGMRQEQASDAGKTEPLQGPLMLPEGFSIKDAWIAGRSGTGEQTVGIGVEGRSRTYGFRLEAPAGESRWIVISGATGEQQVGDNEAQSRAIQQILAQQRLDAP